MKTDHRKKLKELLALYGLQSSYVDALGNERSPSEAAQLQILSSLGVTVDSARDLDDTLNDTRERRFRTPLEPVTVVFDGHPLELTVRVPATALGRSAKLRIRLEDGGERAHDLAFGRLPIRQAAQFGTARYFELVWRANEALPLGYHRLELELEGRAYDAHVFSAPTHAWICPNERTFGVFAPAYAVRRESSTFGGDLGDLAALHRFASQFGSAVIGTLPMFASFLDDPFEPSPYSPVSRLFWNELFVDVDAVPELERCPQARAKLSGAGRVEIDALRAMPLVDYRRLASAKRAILEDLSDVFFASSESERDRFEDALASRPSWDEYARFRARVERDGAAHAWSHPEGAFDEKARRYHLYAQWRMCEQLDRLAQEARSSGLGLYLDFPLGVHPLGYDAFTYHADFMPGCSAGAPPDLLFTRGQNWGFAPLHPVTIREHGYEYLRACLRESFSRAGVLRIDHVMWLHRIFCVPPNMEAVDGVYLHYRPEELYAIFCLESHRNQCMLIGEDLGTVPPQVRTAMERHRILRMYIVQYEARASDSEPLTPIPRDALVSLNTHDMPPFAAFWKELDIADRVESGLTDEATAEAEISSRRQQRAAFASLFDWAASALESPPPGSAVAKPKDDLGSVLDGALALLASSDARVLLVNLEDLWLETEPQNVPGTGPERPNWRRKLRHSVDDMERMAEVVSRLRVLARHRGRSDR